MDTLKEIKKALREIVEVTPNLPITGIVTKVVDDHCTVKLKNGLEISDVKLKATRNNEDNYLQVIPEIGSTVILISLTGKVDNLFIAKVDKVDKVCYKQNGLEVLIDGTNQKLSLKNDYYSLLEVLTDLTEILKGLKVYTSVGPSGTPLPDTIAKIKVFENNFKQLLI